MEVNDIHNYVLDSDEEDVVERVNQLEEGEIARIDDRAPSLVKTKKTKLNHEESRDAAEVSSSIVEPKSTINLRSFGRPRVLAVDSSEYSCLSKEKLQRHMAQIVEDTSGIIQVSPATTQLLLSKLKWDNDRVVERYYEDSEKLYRDTNVIDPSSDVIMSSPSGDCCEICFSEMDSFNTKQSACGHRFCFSCWEEYLEKKIMLDGASSTITCPAHKCQIMLSENFILEILTDHPQVLEMYNLARVKGFVQVVNNVRWCPGTSCKSAIKLAKQAAEWVNITCHECRSNFCFLCGEPWHDPVICQLLAKWLKKAKDDSETSNWICSNTKDCPGCHASIEKNGGCNQMHCFQNGCKVAFCWICLKIGNAYQPHGCNVYESKGDVTSRRAALERYLFYETRYTTHEQSLKLEIKLTGSMNERKEELINTGMTWMDTQFLDKSIESLRVCRQTLMYTYCFAFFLKKNSEQEIFESNQADLEIAVEKLSGFLERKTDIKADEMKRRMLDLMAYCKDRRVILVNHVYEGYEKESWVFNV